MLENGICFAKFAKGFPAKILQYMVAMCIVHYPSGYGPSGVIHVSVISTALRLHQCYLS